MKSAGILQPQEREFRIMATKTLTGIFKISRATAAQWASTNKPIDAGVLAFETDTLKAKVGNGTALYSALNYAFNALSDEVLAILDNAGGANGAVVADANGLIPASQIPQEFKNKTIFVADIAARDAIPEAQRTAIVFVADATGDVTVETGMAQYIWDATNSAWIKVGEQESMDIDFSQFLTTESTLDDIQDGSTYVRTTVAEKALIGTALQETDTVIFDSLGAAHWTE